MIAFSILSIRVEQRMTRLMHRALGSWAGPDALKRIIHWSVIALTVTLITACEPSKRTPGLWLRGTTVDTLPSDWSFTDDYPEIFVQVRTPYFLPHSVTIWCGQVDGNLYIGAREAESKNWPGWLERDRDIRLKIGDKLYEVTAADIASDDTLAAVRAAYATKYGLPPPVDGETHNVTYWSIVPRG